MFPVFLIWYFTSYQFLSGKTLTSQAGRCVVIKEVMAETTSCEQVQTVSCNKLSVNNDKFEFHQQIQHK